jgi:site-specific recombinase XerD
MCLLGYAGFLRFSELASLKKSDISFFPSYVKLYLEKSKTDVIEKGSVLLQKERDLKI